MNENRYRHHTNFCTPHDIMTSQRHDPHRVLTHCSLFKEARLNDSILVLQIRNDILKVLDFQVILVKYSLRFGVHCGSEDADLVSIHIYFSLAWLQTIGVDIPWRALTLAPASMRLLTESGRARMAA